MQKFSSQGIRVESEKSGLWFFYLNNVRYNVKKKTFYPDRKERYATLYSETKWDVSVAGRENDVLLSDSTLKGVVSAFITLERSGGVQSGDCKRLCRDLKDVMDYAIDIFLWWLRTEDAEVWVKNEHTKNNWIKTKTPNWRVKGAFVADDEHAEKEKARIDGRIIVYEREADKFFPLNNRADWCRFKYKYLLGYDNEKKNLVIHKILPEWCKGVPICSPLEIICESCDNESVGQLFVLGEIDSMGRFVCRDTGRKFDNVIPIHPSDKRLFNKV